ncbi:MAG: CBS domain-containing protein [Victivallales bacterium]|nr:CBS domain-containing protein [Victivallales bacterium]
MNVSYLMAEKKKHGIAIYSIPNTSTLKDAARELKTHNVGALLVSDPDDGDRLTALISERDVIRYCCEDAPLDQIQISSVVSSDMIVITQNDTLETARGIMKRHHIRHLPVIVDGDVCGMVTIRDVNNVMEEQKNLHIQHMSDFLGGTYGNKVY